MLEVLVTENVFLLSILSTVIIYFLVMGAAFVKPFTNFLDYDYDMLSALGLYIIGSSLVFFTTQLNDILAWQVSYWALMCIVIPLVMFYGYRWQENGRPYMPKTKFSGSLTTLYDFTPKYAFVKVFEIMFQNLCAASVIFTFYEITNDVLLTSLYFALTFILLHSFSMYFLGKAWIIFILIAFFLILAITPIVILVPFGFGFLFLFHVACYILFLQNMKHRFAAEK